MKLTFEEVVKFLSKKTQASPERIRQFAELYSAGERNGRAIAKAIPHLNYRTAYRWLDQIQKAEASASGVQVEVVKHNDQRLTRDEAISKLDQAIRACDDDKTLALLLRERASLSLDWRRNENEDDEINPFHTFGPKGREGVEQALIERLVLLCYNRAALPSFWKSLELAASDPEAFLKTLDPDRVIQDRISASDPDAPSQSTIPGSPGDDGYRDLDPTDAGSGTDAQESADPF